MLSYALEQRVVDDNHLYSSGLLKLCMKNLRFISTTRGRLLFQTSVGVATQCLPVLHSACYLP